jgi:DNA-binding LytR/AlgR family response regulator
MPADGGLRALIVDDEPVARKILREELHSMKGVEVVGEATNGEAALLEISAKQPDLVFLDVEMPGMGGFEMLAHLSGGRMPVVIMVTAYDQHAIRAFEAGALDYLLKPVSQERLQQAMSRAARLRREPALVAEKIASLQELRTDSEPGQTRLRKIVGKIGEEFFLLNPQEILAFHAEGELVWIVTAKNKYQAALTLKEIEDRLRHSSFRRIHRNALVNVNQIRKMSMLSSQRWLVTLNNGQEFIVSKRQAGNVRDVLHW